jgi:metallo-beta-lactamase class B
VRENRRRSFLIVLCLLAAIPAAAQKDPVSRSWNQPVPPFNIVANVWYVGASDVTSFLITTKSGHILIDGGFEETAPMIVANIRTLGFDPRDVKLLLGSHAHYDHAGGLAELKRVTGAQFLASAREVPLYARGGLDDPQFGNLYPFPRIVADRIVRDGEKVRLGGTTLTARVTPGHTPGCMTWLMQAGKHQVVFVGSPSVPSDYVLRPRDIEDYRSQFRILKSLRPDVFLASHGNFFDLEAKRKTGNFVDRDGYRSFVATFEERFEKRARESR